MNFKTIKTCLVVAAIAITNEAWAQQAAHYTATTLNNPDYHHGQLQPAVGVHNIQVMRANREHPEFADNFGYTYNHAPMLAYWNNRFYLEYLSDSVGEHIPPAHTYLVTSKDGYAWGKPQVLFPAYKIPDGTTKEGRSEVAENLFAVMHQRMGFYVSDDERLLALGYYSICMAANDSPNDGLGIGRVVREIYKDGSFGPIYFIRYNLGWNAKNTDFPYYKKAKDKKFVKACDALMNTPLMMQQWVEEADRDDPLIPLKKQYKAFSYYHLPNGNVVGLWKHALTGISQDEGKTWSDIGRAPGFINGNAKIWGQQTSNGKFATVYNPSDFRWPLALSVSEDGLEYTNLLLVHGEITPMRYGGNYKSYGPQYVRGIVEGNGTPPDNKLWITYSVNKEDIWVSGVKVPITAEVSNDVKDVFNEMTEGQELDFWNIYSPAWARVQMKNTKDGTRVLSIADKDEFDYAKAERVFPENENVRINFSIEPAQNNSGELHIELQDGKNTGALRLIFDADGYLKYKDGYRVKNIMAYEAGKKYDVRINATCHNRLYDVFVNGKKVKTGLFFAPVHSLEKLVFRTGPVRRFPDTDTPTDQDYDLKTNGLPETEAEYFIYEVSTEKLAE